MNPEIKAKWIAALESGDYKKGKFSLKDAEGGYCCLGVLCCVHEKETGLGCWTGRNYKGQACMLPDEVAEWAGLPAGKECMVFKYKYSGNSANLVSLNDNSPTFKRVIQAIKSYF